MSNAQVEDSAVEARFWSKVDRTAGEHACWPWTGARARFGYGKACTLGVSRKWEHAQRAAYRFTFGPIPDGLHVLHRCDNPPCCNPAHLFLGTNAANMADKLAKGRNRPPPRKSHCKRGHPLSGSNLYVQTRADRAAPDRRCRQCDADRKSGRLTPTITGGNHAY